MLATKRSAQRILFIRHAESAANAGLSTFDPAGIPLTPAGEAAAEQAAREFDALVPDRIIISPYRRAQQTAEPFRRRFAAVPVEEWPVQEFTYIAPARCMNTTMLERKPMVDAYWENAESGYVDGEGAESFAAFLDRVELCLHRLESTPGRVMVFTHEMFMKAVLWEGRKERDRMRPKDFRTYATSYSIPNLAAFLGTQELR